MSFTSHVKDQSTSKLLVSACLLGEPVRYDQSSRPIHHPFIQQLKQEERLIILCPEVAAGLPVPRPSAEIQTFSLSEKQTQSKVLTQDQEDLTQTFARAAEIALNLAQEHHIRYALLKSKSPSCGSGLIYDGNFNGTLVKGDGITTSALQAFGVTVFNEHQIDELAQIFL